VWEIVSWSQSGDPKLLWGQSQMHCRTPIQPAPLCHSGWPLSAPATFDVCIPETTVFKFNWIHMIAKLGPSAPHPQACRMWPQHRGPRGCLVMVAQLCCKLLWPCTSEGRHEFPVPVQRFIWDRLAIFETLCSAPSKLHHQMSNHESRSLFSSSHVSIPVTASS